MNAGTAPAAEGRFSRRPSLRTLALEYSSWILLAVLVIVGASVTPLFFTTENFVDILYQSSIIGIMAVCGFVGAATGAVIAYGRMPPFIVTFGTLAIVRGLALTITSGGPVNLGDSWFLAIGTGIWPQVIWAVVIVLGYILLAKLPIGRHIYATGGNEDAARVSGINSKGVLILVYTISALCAAIGGLIFTARSTVALPTYGQGYELQTIAACVLGGTDLFGGIGKLSGVVLGVIILTMLGNILNLTGVNPFWNFIAIGIALWISVSFRSRLQAGRR
ncbi:MAG: ABC transporter permease [Rhizobiales bacterium]|nr:ABC transporter permease [Hyphomicrobiales bacterium]